MDGVRLRLKQSAALAAQLDESMGELSPSVSLSFSFYVCPTSVCRGGARWRCVATEGPSIPGPGSVEAGLTAYLRNEGH